MGWPVNVPSPKHPFVVALFAVRPLNAPLQQVAQGALQAPTVARVPPASFAHLAQSPASSLLADQFFAAERQREAAAASGHLGPLPVAVGRPTAAASSPSSALASSSPVLSASLDGALRLDQYHSLEEIYAFVDALPRRYKRLQVFTIGRTAENRPIKALELTNNATDPDFVWLDALTHAREWITGSTLLYALDRLVAGPPANAAPSSLYAKNYIIVPVVNPDGYSYTWTTNRMWRKNRSRQRAGESKCIGVSSVGGQRPATPLHQLR